MFGIKILTRKGLRELEKQAQKQAQDHAIAELVALLRKSDRVFLEPVTLVGDGQIVEHCAFLGIQGTALTIKPGETMSERIDAKTVLARNLRHIERDNVTWCETCHQVVEVQGHSEDCPTGALAQLLEALS